MKKLLKALKENFGDPDVTTPFKAGDLEFDVIFINPYDDDDDQQSNICTLGLSISKEGKKFDTELWMDYKGILPEEAGSAFGGFFHGIFKKMLDDGAVEEKVYYATSTPFFEGMNAVMMSNPDYSAYYGYLDEDRNKTRRMQITPLYEQEARELETVPAVTRGLFMTASDINFLDPGRKPVSIAKVAVTKFWTNILQEYKRKMVKQADLLESALKKGGGDQTAAALEEKLGFASPLDFKTSLGVMHHRIDAGDFELLTVDEILDHWNNMNDLVKQGLGPNAKKKVSDEPEMKRVYWHERWIPIGHNSSGDMLCIDMDPGEEGTIGQLIIHTTDMGPRLSDHTSFLAWLEGFATELEDDDAYRVNKAGYLVREEEDDDYDEDDDE